MNCQEVVERMHRYLDRDLTSDETAEMYQHIALCPMCAETFNILKSLNRELEDLPAVTPPVSLVDAIMPRLDAIDRDRHNLVIPPAVKNQEPAEMMPEIRRPRRAGSWWSTVGGRTAIGAAAAVLILGVAIFNNEPKMLSDAEIPYEEASTTSAGSTEESTEIQDQGTPQLFTDGGAAANSTEKEGSDPSDSTQSSALESSTESDPDPNETKGAAEPSDAPKDTGEETPAPDASVKKNDEGVPQAPEQPATSNNEVPKSNATSPSAPPASEPQQNNEGANGQTPPSESADTKPETLSPSNDPSADAGAGSAESSERSMGIAMMPEQWSSPDGLYRASLELDQLVIYRLPSGSNTSPEAMETLEKIPLSGKWISGQWSEDGLTFKYKVQMNSELVESVYSIEKTEPPAATQQKKPKQ
ncbi:zf-HC2 domain-containing protein [Paenibacillus glucanolyticus]|uniref:zf-HC2 domain-containing protein n=1 Tax=Paenibacillus glucanolyticus TaxID=59843 RepID=UPI00128C49FD|nr:zf-HC2 domain-containing protein [Paenibacillus glucanolyticus]MPY19559.1 anti-sigma factor [Paenibacillus glucanolyticus]